MNTPDEGVGRNYRLVEVSNYRCHRTVSYNNVLETKIRARTKQLNTRYSKTKKENGKIICIQNGFTSPSFVPVFAILLLCILQTFSFTRANGEKP